MDSFDRSRRSSRLRPRPRISLLGLRPGFLLSAFFLLPLLAACGEAGSGSSGELEVVREQDGDTLVVRTVAGSEWGVEADLVPEVEIGVLDGDQRYMFGSIRSVALDPAGRMYAMDVQIPALRVYDADGSHVGDWGRRGGGPGEFGGPDGGLAVLSDGRVVVRDPGNARMQVFSAEGEALEEWSVVPGGFNSSNPMFLSDGDTLLTPLVINLGVDDIANWRTGLVRVTPDGQIVDSIPVPDVDYESPTLRASRDGNTSISTLPFSPSEDWTWHPDGYFLHGISDRYAISLLDPENPLRIERVADPVPVAEDEKTYRRDAATRNMRGTDPNWRWDGPGIPDRKPAFQDLKTGLEGRIWVQRPTPGVRIENPDWDPQDPESEAPEHTWTESVTWDVFEADGTFLGTVHAPRGFSIYPAPVFSGDLVLATTRDDLGVQRLVRYRIQLRTPEDG